MRGSNYTARRESPSKNKQPLCVGHRSVAHHYHHLTPKSWKSTFRCNYNCVLLIIMRRWNTRWWLSDADHHSSDLSSCSQEISPFEWVVLSELPLSSSSSSATDIMIHSTFNTQWMDQDLFLYKTNFIRNKLVHSISIIFNKVDGSQRSDNLIQFICDFAIFGTASVTQSQLGAHSVL